LPVPNVIHWVQGDVRMILSIAGNPDFTKVQSYVFEESVL